MFTINNNNGYIGGVIEFFSSFENIKEKQEKPLKFSQFSIYLGVRFYKKIITLMYNIKSK